MTVFAELHGSLPLSSDSSGDNGGSCAAHGTILGTLFSWQLLKALRASYILSSCDRSVSSCGQALAMLPIERKIHGQHEHGLYEVLIRTKDHIHSNHRLLRVIRAGLGVQSVFFNKLRPSTDNLVIFAI